jgi:long-subunit acyl-CoA synthetase (AMP-forming)
MPAATAATRPDGPAVVFREPDVRWTWAQFKHEIDRFAAGLSALGLRGGDRLCIWSLNRAQWLVTQFAPLASVCSWSTSIPRIGSLSLNTRSMHEAAGRSSGGNDCAPS